MRDFKLTSDGDIDISTGDIRLVSGNELKLQRIATVLGTTKGEWEYDDDEGINTRAIVGKNPNEAEIIDNIRDGLRQVDESLSITEYNFETHNRKLFISLCVSDENGTEMNFVIGQLDNSTTPVVASLDANIALRAGSALEALTICAATTGVYKGDI